MANALKGDLSSLLRRLEAEQDLRAAKYLEDAVRLGSAMLTKLKRGDAATREEAIYKAMRLTGHRKVWALGRVLFRMEVEFEPKKAGRRSTHDDQAATSKRPKGRPSYWGESDLKTIERYRDKGLRLLLAQGVTARRNRERGENKKTLTNVEALIECAHSENPSKPREHWREMVKPWAKALSYRRR
jgi:hypothetical protein